MYNEFDDILRIYGMYLNEDDTDEMNQNPDQSGQEEESENIEGDDDETAAMLGATSDQTTTEVDNIETIERIKCLNILKSIYNILSKLSLLDLYTNDYTINEYKNLTLEIINNIDIYSTDDLLEFKKILVSKINKTISSLNVKKKFKESLDLNLITDSEYDLLINTDEYILTENLHSQIYEKNNMKFSASLDDIIEDLKNKIDLKIKDIDSEDETIKVFGLNYNKNIIEHLLEDSYYILTKYKRIFHKDENKKLTFFNKRESIVEKKSIIIFKFTPFEIHNNKISINMVSDKESIIEYLFLLKYYFIFLEYKKLYKYLPLKDYVKGLQLDIIGDIILKVFKLNINDEISEFKNNLEKHKNLDSNINILRNNKNIKHIDYIEAANEYMHQIFSTYQFIETNTLFINSYSNSFKNFIRLYSTNNDKIFFVQGNSFTTENMSSLIHTFINSISLKDILEGK